MWGVLTVRMWFICLSLLYIGSPGPLILWIIYTKIPKTCILYIGSPNIMRSPRSGKVRFGNTWHKRGHTRWEGKRGEAMIWVTFASYRCAATTLTSPSIQRTRAEELRLLKRQVLILLVLGGDFARSPLPSRIRARERRGREEGGRIWRRRIITILAGRGVHGRQLPFLQRCSFGCQPANITRSSLSHSTTALILGARLIGSKCLSDHNAKCLWNGRKF